MSDKSLQININSVDDAKAVIQHLGAIKVAYEAHACTSIELCIAEEVVTPTAKILVGAFPWCTHFRKNVRPFGENIHFQLPHFVDYSRPGAPVRVAEPAAASVDDLPGEPKAPKVNRYLRNLDTTGKSASLVQTQPSGAA